VGDNIKKENIMSDKICIKNLKVDCEIGVNDDERGRKQPVLFDIELDVNLAKAAQSDNLKDTVDYFELTGEIVRMVENSHFQLIEKLADYVADFCLKKRVVLGAKVTLTKPEAIKQFGAEVSVVVKK
jgi:D-erythro-7,8-dihydroneopterin triphosphate epimerase